MTSQSGSDAPSPALNAAAPLLAPSIRRCLGQHLREAYASLEDERPDRFAVLIARLEAVLAARGETLTAEVRQGLRDHAPGLRKYALSLTRDAARADDLVQDTMLRAWMYRESFSPGTNVCGWLTIIMRNTFYSGQRKRVHEVEDSDGSYAAQLVTLPAQGAVLDLEDVNAAIGRLSDTLRQALTLVAIDNMTYDEAATVMGCKIGTVKSRVWRARESLAALVGYSADEIGPDRLANAVLGEARLQARA